MSGDVLVRAWEPNLRDEGARFMATIVRRDITFQAAIGHVIEPETFTRSGIVVIAPSAGVGNQNAVDVCVRAIPDQIKFTILSTDELVWFPINSHRDHLNHWHIEAIPFIDWLRIKLRDEPALMGTPDGRS